MRFHTFVAAAVLALSPVAARGQSASFNFTVDQQGFTGVSPWSHANTPATPSGGTAWSIPFQSSPSQFALTSPTTALVVTVAGTVTGSITHRYNFAQEPDGGEGFVAHDGGVIEYRKNGTGGWVRLSESQVHGEGYNAQISSSFPNPLGGSFGFTGVSEGYGDPVYVTNTFTLGGTANALFVPTDVVEIRFVAGFAGDLDDPGDPSWQIGLVTLNDATPVPETGGVLGVAAVALAGLGLRRRLTSAASRRTPAS